MIADTLIGTVTVNNGDKREANQQPGNHLLQKHPFKKISKLLCLCLPLRENLRSGSIACHKGELSQERNLGILQGVALIESKGSIW